MRVVNSIIQSLPIKVAIVFNLKVCWIFYPPDAFLTSFQLISKSRPQGSSSKHRLAQNQEELLAWRVINNYLYNYQWWKGQTGTASVFLAPSVPLSHFLFSAGIGGTFHLLSPNILALTRYKSIYP